MSDQESRPKSPPASGGVPSREPETTVTIDTPGVTVTITTTGDLDHVAAKALELFQQAGGWPQPRPNSSSGFVHLDRRHQGDAAGSSMWVPPAPVGFGTMPDVR